jgi:hypothetical protein
MGVPQKHRAKRDRGEFGAETAQKRMGHNEEQWEAHILFGHLCGTRQPAFPGYGGPARYYPIR